MQNKSGFQLYNYNLLNQILIIIDCIKSNNQVIQNGAVSFSPCSFVHCVVTPYFLQEHSATLLMYWFAASSACQFILSIQSWLIFLSVLSNLSCLWVRDGKSKQESKIERQKNRDAGPCHKLENGKTRGEPLQKKQSFPNSWLWFVGFYSKFETLW